MAGRATLLGMRQVYCVRVCMRRTAGKRRGGDITKGPETKEERAGREDVI